ncbi:MAG: helix-turn-helix domain-containing GNAT family N-acetyltransferase [Firmicutes bacterium]|nr:helix-turn-helix domain-containing GNAT family N-acetyltransferase [Bacillota bacterium]
MAAPNSGIVQNIRQFNRFYTNIIGVLDRHILNSSFSLAEARVLLEISRVDNCTATKLIALLNLDAGYLSRIIKGFERQNLICRQKSSSDGRSNMIYVTEKGRRVLAELAQTSNRQIESLIDKLPAEQQLNLVHCMKSIHKILTGERAGPLPVDNVRLRHGVLPGDIGSIINLHGIVYAVECGYNHQFEGYVCSTFQAFAESYDPGKDRLWIAETDDGITVAAIAILGYAETTAQLRWFIIHPLYRGRGLGWRMLDGALRFCREKGYKKIFLLTTSDQQTASYMYSKVGFVKTGEQPMQVWGQEMVEERFELTLAPEIEN